MIVGDTDGVTCPCLWVGTSLGSVLVVAFGLPTDGDRNTEPVSVMPSGVYIVQCCAVQCSTAQHCTTQHSEPVSQ